MADTGENMGKRLVSLKVHANYVHEVIESFGSRWSRKIFDVLMYVWQNAV